MAKKIALGKGIASLIQETPNEILKQSLKTAEEEAAAAKAQSKEVVATGPLMIPVSKIKANPGQPRKIFKEKELEELSQSIKENGIIQPLVVVELADGGFELVAGERRMRAAKRAGIEHVPVVVKKATDKEKMVMAIIENVQRSDLNCVEEALAYYQLMEDFQLTQEEVAKKLGKERSSIANYLRILKLPREVIEKLQKEELSFGHAKVLAALREREQIIRLANECVASELSVRELEALAKKSNKPKMAKETNPFYDEKLEDCREKLERSTGFHFQIKSKKTGQGQIVLKFSNEAEFNDIYEYLLKRSN